VIAEDGNTYERSAIEQWFATGQRTSPLTRQRMSTTLLPNRAIREEVERLTAAAVPAAAAAAAPVVVDGPLSTAAFYDEARHLLHVQFAADAPGADAPSAAAGTDMILLLDTSGSMDSLIASPTTVATVATATKDAQQVTRLDIAKHSARVLAALCSPTDRIALITFNSAARVAMAFTAMDAAGKARLDAVLGLVFADGATNLWDALRVAVDMANSSSTLQQRKVAAILLTDGEPTMGTPPRGIVPTLRSALTLRTPWVLHALGFSDQVDSKLLCEIAEWGHGSFGFIPSGDMVGTVCINTASHCLSVAHRGTSLVAPSGTVVETGPLLVQQPRDFVFPCASCPDSVLLTDAEAVPVVKRSLDQVVVARAHLLRILDLVLATSYGHAMESLLHEFVRTYTGSEDPRVRLMLRDVASANKDEGQVLLAAKYLGTWGFHYLRCYRNAQQLQHCVNFKDVGLQDYGGPLFKRLVTAGDKTFALMPSMVVTQRPGTATASAGAGRPAPAPIDYSMFHNASGGCFAGECRVRMCPLEGADEVRIPIADITRGDVVWTPSGPALVLFAVEINTTARSQPMTQLGRLSITPWHPVVDPDKNGRVWAFPAHLNGFSDRLVQTVYNLVLTSGHIIDVEGIQCVTLAHGFEEEPVAHAFFGTQAVVDCLLKQPGSNEGRPVYTNLVADKNEAGVICGWREG